MPMRYWHRQTKMPRRCRTSAKTQGYEEGRASAEQENEQLRVQLEESYGNSREILSSDYRDKREHMEQDLVDVIVTVFEKVFHIQFDDKKDDTDASD